MFRDVAPRPRTQEHLTHQSISRFPTIDIQPRRGCWHRLHSVLPPLGRLVSCRFRGKVRFKRPTSSISRGHRSGIPTECPNFSLLTGQEHTTRVPQLRCGYWRNRVGARGSDAHLNSVIDFARRLFMDMLGPTPRAEVEK